MQPGNRVQPSKASFHGFPAVEKETWCNIYFPTLPCKYPTKGPAAAWQKKDARGLSQISGHDWNEWIAAKTGTLEPARHYATMIERDTWMISVVLNLQCFTMRTVPYQAAVVLPSSWFQLLWWSGGNLDTKEGPCRSCASSKAILCTEYESLNWSKGSLWWRRGKQTSMAHSEIL